MLGSEQCSINQRPSTRTLIAPPIARLLIRFLWKRSMGYGQRWMAETVFPCIKRMFGEYVNARKLHNMAKELVIKASLYNMFVAMKM